MNEAEVTGSKACSRGLRHSFAVILCSKTSAITRTSEVEGALIYNGNCIYTQIVGDEEKRLASNTWKT